MRLAEKMFTRSSTPVRKRRAVSRKEIRKYSESLFDNADWAVFVIKHDEKKGRFDWFTLCCEQIKTDG